MKSIRLREGKERSLLRRHPWVFQGSVEKGKADPGETVRIEASDGRFLAWGAYSPTSTIRVRAWSFDEAERIDAAFFARRIAAGARGAPRLPIDERRRAAGARRSRRPAGARSSIATPTRWSRSSCRPAPSAGSRPSPTRCSRRPASTRLYERSDSGVRALEGLAPATGWLRGEGATELTIREHGWRLTLDVAEGHKTGFYLDQRDNREGLRRRSAALRLPAGAQLLLLHRRLHASRRWPAARRACMSVDSSAPALERAQANVALNGFDVRLGPSLRTPT